jgi:hypothetical protein
MVLSAWWWWFWWKPSSCLFDIFSTQRFCSKTDLFSSFRSQYF